MSDEFIRSLNLTSPADVRRALDLLNIRPLKSQGQNFLIDANILGIILKTADLSANDQVLEIGAGLGALTEVLAGNVRRVVTVEKDLRLSDFLRSRFQPFANIELISADVMRLDLVKFWSSGINKMVANLPYSVGSAVLAGIFKSDSQPEMIVVTLQTEVAKRLAAESNTSDYGLLSIWSQLSYETEICKVVSPNCFFPKPDVQSAILRMKKRQPLAEEPANRGFFFALTKYAFGQRRKQLQKILSNAPPQFRRPPPELQNIFQEMKIDPRTRPEALSVGQWIQLANLLYRQLNSNII
ncbi:MAG: 16S rRNA (adenine(1518)-N(6)/adenine(1519)-N(6))-dimethyltransferase RsmA [Kiritimatiellia bacterium]|nr:16S rRNA (adenine(1518)-N(6)/adenine(1519)-N(6))-dimethyltransferase RsmA [Kiritimatiellia bacterium]